MDNKGQSEFQQNAMGAGVAARYTSSDGSVTGTFQYLMTDNAGATLTSYTLSEAAGQITDDWEIGPNAIFGPFSNITQFEVSAGQVIAVSPVEY